MPLLLDTPNATTQVRAQLLSVVYHENGYLIARARTDQGKRITVLGAMAEPALYQDFEFAGRMEWNDRFHCNQLRFDTFRTILPNDALGIERYLAQTAKWIGPRHAHALVQLFGDETLDVVKTNPARARGRVAGLTDQRLEEMSETLRANERLEAATIEITNLLAGALPPAIARRAIRKWGCDAATLIRRDPYRLTRLPGVGFVSADAVYKRLGKREDAPKRHAFALLHTLAETAAREGHTVLQAFQAQAGARKLVGGLRDGTLRLCARARAVHADNGSVQLADLADAESYVASKLAAIADAGRKDKRNWPTVPPDGLAADQLAAVRLLESSPVSILTGAPGTGKTYTLARVVGALDKAGKRIALCAPTGKAAKQMSLALRDVCPGGAVTIHSLLGPEYDSDTGEFHFAAGPDDPLPDDVVVCDEFSMVDVRLARSLLGALRATTRCILVGDHYQLPSVGPGAVLRDAIAGGVPSAELTEIKRNAGLIVRACHAIKDGRVPQPADRLDLDAGDNWRHIPAGSPAEILAIVERLLTEKLPECGVEPKWEAQLISPTNDKGPLSCDVLNRLARGIINPAAGQERGLAFSVDDKVVRTKNGQARGRELPESDRVSGDATEAASPEITEAEDCVRIVNGDLGTVTAIDKSDIHVDLRYPRRAVQIKRAEHHLKLAYCMTCHKMQGSEVDVLILPLHSSYVRMPMWTREWVYTALSRAKRFVVTVGDLEALRRAVGRVGTNQRQTALRNHIVQHFGGTPDHAIDFSDV